MYTYTSRCSATRVSDTTNHITINTINITINSSVTTITTINSNMSTTINSTDITINTCDVWPRSTQWPYHCVAVVGTLVRSTSVSTNTGVSVISDTMTSDVCTSRVTSITSD